MVTLILAAGYATRLYPLSLDTPKPLFEVGGKRIIDYILEKVAPLPNEAVYVVTNNKFYNQFVEWKVARPEGNLSIVNDGTNTKEERLGVSQILLRNLL